VKPLIAPLKLRSPDSTRKVSWLELFFDLIFVAAVAQVAEPLRHHYAAVELLRLTPLFVLIWWAWTGHATFATRFQTDDTIQRGLTLLQMFAVAVMAANAKDALGSEASAGFAAAYAAMRIILVGQYLRARRIPAARALASRYAAGHGVAATVWLISAVIPAPARFLWWAIAFAIDLGTPWLAVRHSVTAPPDASHLPERFGLFTIILLGDSVVAVMQGMESQTMWTPAAATSAFLGMGLLFVLWWWYFDGAAGAAERPVRTRADSVRFHVWTYVHFPLYLGIIVAGVGLRRIVSAASRVDLSPEEAFVLAGAVGVVMLAMTAIGATVPARTAAPGARWRWHIALAAVPIALGASGLVTSPVALILVLSSLCVSQLGVSFRAGVPA
jgi:low temperature requirement protein LtrA